MPRCYADPRPIFYPAMRLITAISNSNPAQVTTSFDHNYINGIVVRLDIPFADGMQEANNFVGPLIVTSPTTFTIDLDTTNFSAFFLPDPETTSPHVQICAMVVPIGEVNSSIRAATRNVLPTFDLPTNE